MLLSTAPAAHNAEALMGRVMMIFGAFWVVALVILFVAIGALLKKHERLSQHSGH